LEYPALRRQSVEILGRLGPDAADAVPALLKYVDDDDPEMRADILTTLGHIGPGAKEGIDVVMKALDDQDEEVVVSAVYAIGKIGPEAVDCVNGVKGLLDGGDPRFQTVCAWALVKVMPDNEEYRKIALPLLIKALERDDDSVRSEAASTLGAIGSAAQGAVAKLQELAENDANPEVRELASEALREIGQ
ncbi:MAG: HEAT repeat domain-containing protein, partial [Bythopirellula sp.]